MSEYVKVAEIKDVPPGSMYLVDLDGEDVVLANVDGQIFAFSGTCTHHWARLDLGELEGEVVTCPFHGGQFNVRTGEAVAPPAALPVATYPVRMEGNAILVARP